MIKAVDFGKCEDLGSRPDTPDQKETKFQIPCCIEELVGSRQKTDEWFKIKIRTV